MACSNCGSDSSPLWRRGVNNEILCNACGLYFKHHNVMRPAQMKRLPSRHQADSVGSKNQTDSENIKRKLIHAMEEMEKMESRDSVDYSGNVFYIGDYVTFTMDTQTCCHGQITGLLTAEDGSVYFSFVWLIINNPLLALTDSLTPEDFSYGAINDTLEPIANITNVIYSAPQAEHNETSFIAGECATLLYNFGRTNE